MKQIIIAFFVVSAFGFFQGCGDLGRAITETTRDTTREFNKEYGAGAGKSLSRGSKGLISIEPYRTKINNLHDNGAISAAERNSRLDRLFKAYDSYSQGNQSRSSFEHYAASLAKP